MSIIIGELEFQGPFLNINKLSDAPGIFAVINTEDRIYELVEMNDTDQVKETLLSHPHLNTWQKICPELAFAVHYTDKISAEERQDVRESAERKRLYSSFN